jgi:hypothetical protein
MVLFQLHQYQIKLEAVDFETGFCMEQVTSVASLSRGIFFVCAAPYTRKKFNTGDNLRPLVFGNTAH